MSLEISSRSPYFFSVLRMNGKRKKIALRCKYAGVPPEGYRISSLGDPEFEASRKLALEEEAKLAACLQKSNNPAQVLAEWSRNGHSELAPTPERLTTDKLYALWLKQPRKRKSKSPKHGEEVRRQLSMFAGYMQQKFSVEDLGAVESRHCKLYVSDLDDGKLTNGSINKRVGILSALYNAAVYYEYISRNPFEKVEELEDDSISRRAFSQQEIEVILDRCRDDPQLHFLIAVGVSTGMRLVDCCQLRWREVDLNRGCIRIKTRKTGKEVAIPLFPMLRNVLISRGVGDPGDFVYPAVAKQYSRNTKLLDKRLKELLLAIGFNLDDADEKSLQVVREKGCRRASTFGFHALKTTFITLAVASGVPVSVLQKVVGNNTVEVIINRYIQLSLDQSRQAFSKLPAVITGLPAPVPDARDQVLAEVEKMNSENWQIVRAEILRKFGSKPMASTRAFSP